MPYFRASYLAAETTPRWSGCPPTTTGLPRNSGRSSSSTETKKASMSTWRIEEVEEVEEVEDVEDEAAAGSVGTCLARKVASFGMADCRYYTLRRIQSEDPTALGR